MIMIYLHFQCYFKINNDIEIQHIVTPLTIDCRYYYHYKDIDKNGRCINFDQLKLVLSI